MSEFEEYDVDVERMQHAWQEVEDIRKERRRRYAIAAAFTAIGVFLLFVAIMMLLERISLPFMNVFWTFIVLTSVGALSFGYGFYRMGVS